MQKVFAVAGLICGVIAIFVAKGAFGVTALQFAGAGVVLVAVAVLI
jgi:hypothetical protein